MRKITIRRGRAILAHHTTASPLSHYGQPVWVVEDADPAPGPAVWEQAGQAIPLRILGVVGGWLVVRQPNGLLAGIIWSDGAYKADLIVRRHDSAPAKRIGLAAASSGRYVVRGAVPMPGSALGCILGR